MGVLLLHPSRPQLTTTTVDSSKRPSLENMTDADVAVNFDLVAAMKSDGPICFHMLPATEKQTQAALFDEKLVQEFLPGLQIVWFSCPQAMWIIEREDRETCHGEAPS
jgi:hypothetical protein